MRCVSCGEDIPPQWVKAIESNICPGCGGDIMTADARNLMEELADALKRMPNDPQGISGWLLSNYRFTKIGSAEPVERFLGSNSGHIHHEGEPSISRVKVANSAYDRFLQRTGQANKVSATKAQVASVKSRSERLQQMSEDVDYYPEDPSDLDEDFDEDDVRTMKEYEAAGIDPFAQKNVRAMVKQGSGGALSPEQIAQMQQAYAQDIVPVDIDGVVRSNVGLNNDLHNLTKEEQALIAKTGPKGKEVVMNARLKRIEAQENFSSGAGSFTRS